MKVCDYCNSIVSDDVMACPNCSASHFSKKCETCGSTYTGAACPTCTQREHDSRMQAEENRKQFEATQRANTGLGWKTALTVFLPFIGGYFLINDNVKKGFRIFAIIWCCLMAIEVSTGPSTQTTGTRLLAAILCLAPVGVYLFRKRGDLAAQSKAGGKIPAAAFGLVLLFSIGGALMANPGTDGQEESASVEASRTAPVVVAPVPSPSAASSATASSAESSSTSSSGSESSSSSASETTEATSSSGVATIAAKDVQLSSKTTYLEYSKKQANPLKYVTADVEDATITADGKIDLTSVGEHAVLYTIALGDETATQEIVFIVRDTKAPRISFVDPKPTIDVGDTFDALANMEFVKDKVDGELAYVETVPKARGKKAGREVFYDKGWYTIEGTVDSSVPGTHQLLVTASDKHGNTTTRELPVTVQEAASAGGAGPAAAQHTYIANANTGKFHLPGCRDVARMKESNKREITATHDEMVSWGYSPCLHCNP